MQDAGIVASSTKKRGYKRRGKGKVTARTALFVAKKAMKMIKGTEEKKYIDYQYAPAAQSFNGSLTCLTAIQQGIDLNQRIGDKITMRYFTIKGTVAINGAAGANAANNVSVMVVCDTQNTGTAPVVTDILANTAVGTANAPDAPLVATTHGRFRVLKREQFTLSINGPNMIAFDWFIKMPKRLQNIFYKSTLGTDVYRNNVYILLISDVNLNDPYVGFYSRGVFVDA